MDSEFMDTIAADVAAAGIRVVRFEFPYMARRRREGGRRPPDRMPVLERTWREIVEQVGADPVWIGGKSMGGRVASMVADELAVAGLVCLGYPFHPPGKPEKLRTEHLETLKTPTLIVQGDRDSLGKRAEVDDYRLSAKIQVVWLADGDHSFKPRVRSGHDYGDHMRSAAAAISRFVRPQ